jgi:hypothetical protein
VNHTALLPTRISSNRIIRCKEHIQALLKAGWFFFTLFVLHHICIKKVKMFEFAFYKTITVAPTSSAHTSMARRLNLLPAE